MRTEVLDDSFVPYGPIPTKISEKLNLREREIFRILMGLSKMGAQAVWVRQQTIAEWTHCHIDTVGRAIRSIIKKGFIKFTGGWHQGRHKVYKLIFATVIPYAKNRSKASVALSKGSTIDSALKADPATRDLSAIRNDNGNSTSGISAGGHHAKPTGHVRQFCRNLKNKVNNNYNNKENNKNLENKKNKIYQQAVEKYVDKKFSEAIKLCKIRQSMGYSLHLPSRRLENRCFEMMREGVAHAP